MVKKKGRAQVMPELTEMQAKVYSLVRDRFFRTGSMPTLRELCREMGWKAIGSAQDAISALVEKGWLLKDPQKARGLSLPQREDFRAIPLLGAAPAGVPVEAIESHEKDILIPSFVRGPVFAVRVMGESMLNAGLEDGDIAIVRQSERAKSEEIVVAMLDGEVTIKRFREKRSEIWLYPENPKFTPKKIQDSNFRILGIVVGLHRYWDATWR